MTFESKHFAYYTEDGAPAPCDGTSAWLERYYDAFSSFFGVAPPGQKISYYLYQSRESLSGDVPACESAGCADGQTVRSITRIMAHEIVHAVAFQRGRSPLFFEEGIAEVLDCRDAYDGDVIHKELPVEDLLTTAAFRDWIEKNGLSPAYRTAASFVHFLIDTAGRETFAKFYFSMSGDAGKDQIEQAFERAFSMSVAKALELWRARTPEFPSDTCVHLLDEGVDSLIVDGAELATTPGCGPGMAFGVESLFKVDVPQGGTMALRATTSADYTLTLFRASGGALFGNAPVPAGDPFVASGRASGGMQFLVVAPPGRYLGLVEGQAAAEGEITLRAVTPSLPCASSSAAEVALEPAFPVMLASRWWAPGCTDSPGCPAASLLMTSSSSGRVVALPSVFVDELTSEYTVASPETMRVCSERCVFDQSAPSCASVPIQIGATVAAVENGATVGVELHGAFAGAPPDAVARGMKAAVIQGQYVLVEFRLEPR